MGTFSRIARHADARQLSTANAKLIDKLPGETIDTLFDGQLVLAQSRSGYRFSIDALLLAHFVAVQRFDKVVDLGSGNGVIALGLAHMHRSASITGIELQTAMVERARRSARWNGLTERVKFLHGDVRRLNELPAPGSFDLAVCNPPYRRAVSGRLSNGDERRVARHELNGELGDFFKAAARLVRDKGRVAMVHLALRAVDVLTALQQVGLEPKRLCMVHSFADAQASLLLVEAVKGGRTGLAVQRPLILYRPDQTYSDEAAAAIAGRVSAFNR